MLLGMTVSEESACETYNNHSHTSESGVFFENLSPLKFIEVGKNEFFKIHLDKEHYASYAEKQELEYRSCYCGKLKEVKPPTEESHVARHHQWLLDNECGC